MRYKRDQMRRYRRLPNGAITRDRSIWQDYRKCVGGMDVDPRSRRHQKRVRAIRGMKYPRATGKRIQQKFISGWPANSEAFYREYRRARHATCVLAGIRLVADRQKMKEAAYMGGTI